MKKNLRIVSAAAAALLAVAPVAAVAAPVNAATYTAATNSGFNFNLATRHYKNAVSRHTINTEGQHVLSASTKYAPSTITDTSGATSLTLTKATGSSAVSDAEIRTAHNNLTTRDSFGLGNYTANFNVRYNLPTSGYTHDNGDTVVINGKSYNVEGSTGNYYIEVPFSRPISVVSTLADSSSTSVNAGSSSIFYGDANTAINLNAVAAKFGRHNRVLVPSAVNGNITATVDGKSVTADLHSLDSSSLNMDIYKGKHATGTKVDPTKLAARTLYTGVFRDVRFNLGSSEVGKTVKFVLPNGAVFGTEAHASRTKSVTVNSDGIADLGPVMTHFYAYDATDMKGIHFYAKKTGDVVTSGSVTLHAVNGKLNVESVFAALNTEYGAAQVFDDKNATPRVLSNVDDIKDQLTKAKITVDPNGYFTAPSSFNLTLTATSHANGATATLPVTVNVDNAAASTTSNETTKNVTIMHIATLYDKNGKATNDPVLRAYNSVSVVATPVELKDASGKSLGKFYKLAGQDRYIKVGNVDGTVRTLKHNAYVYKSNGKARKVSKRRHLVRRSGSSIKTYGKSFMIAGSQMYRVGRNQYIKKANFR